MSGCLQVMQAVLRARERTDPAGWKQAQQRIQEAKLQRQRLQRDDVLHRAGAALSGRTGGTYVIKCQSAIQVVASVTEGGACYVTLTSGHGL